MDIRSYTEALRIPCDRDNRVKSLNFSNCGNYLATSLSSNKIVLYDCDQAMMSGTIQTAKYGNGIVKFANSAQKLLQTSSKVDNIVRLIDVEKHAFQLYFNGHSAEVISLDVGQNTNNFITASSDGTVKLWDLRSDRCRNTIKPGGQPIACMHAVTKVVAVGINSELIELFDERMENGPFACYQLPKSSCNWRSIQFQKDGDYLAVGTDDVVIHVLNSYDHNVNTYRDRENNEHVPIDVAFTADGNHLLSGSERGRIMAFNIKTKQKETEICGLREELISCIEVNMRYMMIATGGSDLTLWAPKNEEDEDEPICD